MIDLYYWPTPNGRKISIMMEETGLAYKVIPLDITKGEQFTPEFLKINPNNKIPAIVDDEGPNNQPLALFESGTILEYLAGKSGKLMPKSAREMWITREWVMFQMASFGPMWGQHGHFTHYAPEKVPYAIDRYTKEVLRLLDVINFRLKEVEYLAGDEYTIADVATYPWAITYSRREIDIAAFPHVGGRGAVQRGMAWMSDSDTRDNPTKEHLDAYFGNKQYQRRS
jgi:GSH-dependent disulfide-bond oxidoreductase